MTNSDHRKAQAARRFMAADPAMSRKTAVRMASDAARAAKTAEQTKRALERAEAAAAK